MAASVRSSAVRSSRSIRPSCCLVEHNEFGLYSIHQELERAYVRSGRRLGRAAPELVPLLGNVRDYRRMSDIFRAYQPDTVYHAAAYKHVPMVEHNPCEGVANNVLGTLNVARAAMECGAASFVLISTDKAVRPTNVMGASKRIAELILQALAAETMVRYRRRSAGGWPGAQPDTLCHGALR